MKEYLNDSNLDVHRRLKKSKRNKAQRRRKNLFFLVCCLAITVLVIGLFVNVYPFATDKQYVAPPSTTNKSDTDFHTNSDKDQKNNDDETAWCLILVNKWNQIPDHYDVQLIDLANGQSVDQRIYPALQEMFDAARNSNIYPVVASGFRTADKQQSIMDDKIAEYMAEGDTTVEATTKAEAWVAVPGTSEHQLGIGVDINADGIHSTGEEVYRWLNQNSYKFGFIRRFPADKTDITGVISEPWHYRYVGVAAATEIHRKGICLEEYLDKTN